MNEQRKNIPPVLFALIVAILPHIGRLPLWIVLWCGVMWGYMLLSFKFKLPWPGKIIRRILAAVGIAGLVMTYSMHLGQNAYLGLLSVMAALKPFEMKSHRDRMITVFLAYFIVITSLFLSETLAITLYMLFSVWITTAVLIHINDPFGQFKANFKLSSLIMAQAIPLMIVLFLLFPRIQGSFFGLSLGGKGRSGFSDNLAPGSVKNLVENNEVAFRAMFEDSIPPADLLYWRGIVFQDFNGRSWHTAKRNRETYYLPQGSHPISYTVIMEPNNNWWLFALEMPAKVPSLARLFSDHTLQARRPVNRKLRYEMTSNTTYLAYTTSPRVLRKCRLLPAGVNPKTRILAKQITENTRNEDEKVARLLDYFRTNDFSYTLQPPSLGANSVDDFIFNSKRGYCEHFASALAFMLRSVDIPARIVGGYQGGKVNPYADYLIVRQSDAHVWVEAWFPEKGWRRVDPTAVVAPERITEGMEGALSPQELPGFLSGPYFGFFRQIRYGWDAISTGWSAMFEGYSYAEQRALLEKIGIRSGAWLASFKALFLLLVLIGMFVALYAWFALKSPRRKPDDIKKYYGLFCAKLARAGFVRRPDQGPVDYLQYVAKNRPDLKKTITDITDLYIRLRYREQAPTSVMTEFVQKVRAFDPVLK